MSFPIKGYLQETGILLFPVFIYTYHSSFSKKDNILLFKNNNEFNVLSI